LITSAIDCTNAMLKYFGYYCANDYGQAFESEGQGFIILLKKSDYSNLAFKCICLVTVSITQ